MNCGCRCQNQTHCTAKHPSDLLPKTFCDNIKMSWHFCFYYRTVIICTTARGQENTNTGFFKHFSWWVQSPPTSLHPESCNKYDAKFGDDGLQFEKKSHNRLYTITMATLMSLWQKEYWLLGFCKLQPIQIGALKSISSCFKDILQSL